MSTKTSIKRIALVAVSALGFGLLSGVPAKAINLTYAIALDATAGANTATPVAGAPVTISVTLSGTTKTNDSAASIVTTAAVASKPTNSAVPLTSAPFTAGVLNNAIAWDTSSTVTGATNNTITTVVPLATTAQAASVLGTFTFTPDTAGYYTVTVTPAATLTTAGSDAVTGNTAITVGINVRGASLVQAGSGLGTSLGTQVIDRPSAAVFCTPAGSATTSRYTVSATGATITGAFAGSSKSDAVNASSYTSTSGITQNTPNSFATGFTYAGARATTGVALDGGSDTDCLIVQFTSATAGAATVTARSVNVTTGILTSIGSVTVTYGAVPTVSAALSTEFIGQGNVCATSANTTPIRVPSTAGVALTSAATSGATICINIRDTDNNALVGQAIAATVSGPGLITLATGNGTGSTGTVRTASLTATAMANSSQAVVGISADGTRGVGTITLTAGGITIGTFTVNFYGAVAKLEVTQNYKIARSGRAVTSAASSFTLGSVTQADTGASVATSPAATIKAVDADGNVVPGLTVLADIADSAVIAAVNVVEMGGTASTISAAGPGNFLANVVSAIGGVSGAKTTVTFKVAHPTVAGTFISATPITFSLGGTVTGGKVTMTLDKSTYSPGEKMIVTFTATDAAGNPVTDGRSQAAAVANKAVSGAAISGAYVDGKLVIGDDEQLYAPAASGPFILEAPDFVDGLGVTLVRATATVGAGAAEAAAEAAADAAAEAIDAANAATDAANLAAEAADAATVAAEEARDAADAATAAVEKLATEVATLMAALKAQITTLANTVSKIAKRVRA